MGSSTSGRAAAIWRIAREAGRRFQEDGMSDRAAALTYYALLSLFPALLVGVALLGILGQREMVDDVARYLTDQGAPAETVDAVRSATTTAIAAKGAAVPTLVIALAVGLYGASGAFGAAGRALNAILGIDETRNLVRRKAEDIGWTSAVILLTLLACVLVFVGGGIAGDLFDEIGLGEVAGEVWAVVRWPAALIVATLIYGIIYRRAPDASGQRIAWVNPGAAVAVTLWIVASFGFSLYVDRLASYNATYGAFAGVVILLVWLWITNLALLFGAEINAVTGRWPSAEAARAPAPEPDAAGASAPRDASRGSTVPGR